MESALRKGCDYVISNSINNSYNLNHHMDRRRGLRYYGDISHDPEGHQFAGAGHDVSGHGAQIWKNRKDNGHPRGTFRVVSNKCKRNEPGGLDHDGPLGRVRISPVRARKKDLQKPLWQTFRPDRYEKDICHSSGLSLDRADAELPRGRRRDLGCALLKK